MNFNIKLNNVISYVNRVPICLIAMYSLHRVLQAYPLGIYMFCHGSESVIHIPVRTGQYPGYNCSKINHISFGMGITNILVFLAASKLANGIYIKITE